MNNKIRSLQQVQIFALKTDSDADKLAFRFGTGLLPSGFRGIQLVVQIRYLGFTEL